MHEAWMQSIDMHGMSDICTYVQLGKTVKECDKKKRGEGLLQHFKYYRSKQE